MTTINEVPATWTKVRLVEPSNSGFLYVGASSGARRLPVFLPSTRRRALLRQLHESANELLLDPRVVRADVFQAVLRPPGTPGGNAGEDLRPVSFDAVMLIETTTPHAAVLLAAEAPIKNLRSSLGSPLILAGGNPRRIGSVDHTRQGAFLFNYFSAADVESNLEAWQYTAGWFQDETGLDNSTVIEPVKGASSPYTLINHCRWDHYRDVLPSLIFKRSFHTFVLRVFRDHGVAPRPILYRLHRGTAEGRTARTVRLSGQRLPERRSRGGPNRPLVMTRRRLPVQLRHRKRLKRQFHSEKREEAESQRRLTHESEKG